MRRCWSSRSGWLKSSQIQSRQRPLKPPALVERRGELLEGLTFRLTAARVRLTTPGKLRRSTSQPALSLWRGAAYLLCNHVCAAGFKLDASGCLVGLKKTVCQCLGVAGKRTAQGIAPNQRSSWDPTSLCTSATKLPRRYHCLRRSSVGSIWAHSKRRRSRPLVLFGDHFSY